MEKTTKRYLFSFPERARQELWQLFEEGAFASKGEVVREAVHIMRHLQIQALQGFREVLVRDSKGRERALLISHLVGEESEPNKKSEASTAKKRVNRKQAVRPSKNKFLL